MEEMFYEPIPKRPIRDPARMERMLATIDLFDTACAIMRQNLRRRNPDASEQEIESMLTAWLQKRPLHEAARPGGSTAGGAGE